MLTSRKKGVIYLLAIAAQTCATLYKRTNNHLIQILCVTVKNEPLITRMELATFMKKEPGSANRMIRPRACHSLIPPDSKRFVGMDLNDKKCISKHCLCEIFYTCFCYAAAVI
jgi:hypothetical protein